MPCACGCAARGSTGTARWPDDVRRRRPSRRPPRGRLGLLEHAAWRLGSSAAQKIRFGRLTVVLPDGSRRMFGDASAARARREIDIHDREALVRHPGRRRDRRRRGVRGRPVVQPGPGGAAAARRAEPRVTGAVERLVPRAAAAPPDARAPDAAQYAAGRRRNIAAHYDLGNDFYRLFLDETLTYSCAVFETPDQTLADAQREQVPTHRRGTPGCRAGQHVLEIGSGLGRLRAVRGGGTRLPGNHDHDLAASSTPSRASVSAKRDSPTSSTSSCATTVTSGERTTRSSRSKCWRRSEQSISGRSSRAAIGLCDPVDG